MQAATIVCVLLPLLAERKGEEGKREKLATYGKLQVSA